MKVSTYVADFIAKVNPRVYGVCGAGAMHLNDAIAHHIGIRFLPMHHEQAAAFAAEADARVSGQAGIVHVTSGPGVTNTITGVACAWADSIPMMVIAGQCDSHTLVDGSGVRQLGVSEVDGVFLMASITKYAVCVMDPNDIGFHLHHAHYLATSGRPGPVYIEIPLNVQNAEITEAQAYRRPTAVPDSLDLEVQRFLDLLGAAERPVIVVGHGVRLARACEEMVALINDLEIPVLTTWNASDIVSSSNSHYVGRFGLFGDRPSNFAVQNSDLVIAFGTRLSIPQVGHTPALFAPNAKRIVVDIDPAEANKAYLHADLAIVADIKLFLAALGRKGTNCRARNWGNWRCRCIGWRLRYPVMQAEYHAAKDGVNAYVFMRELSRHLPDDAIVVTDVGTSFVCAQQAMLLNGKQRLFHSSGIAPMGYGLPAAIGACLAGRGRPVICIAGDGGIMFNLQELATIAHHKLPIGIFILVNGGYRTMQVTQGNHFGRETAASSATGIGNNNFAKIGRAFDLPTFVVHNQAELSKYIDALATVGIGIWEVHLASGQQITPRVQSRMQEGKFIPVPIEDMYPYLDRKELAMQMENSAGFLEMAHGSA